MNKERYLLVVSGPSGAGKDTVVNCLLQKHPELEVSVSATTRLPREGEEEGVNYFFMSREQFEQKIARGEMLEYVDYCGHYYGTPKSEVDKRIAVGITVVLVIEVVGAANIKRMYPDSTLVFIMPPSVEELGRRLRARGTEDAEVVARRMARASEEMARAGEYDFSVVNDEVERCADALYDIIRQRQA